MLKKFSFVLVIMIFGLMITGMPVLAKDYSYTYVKTVDLIIGNKIATVNGEVYGMDQAAYVKEGRTLVPFRFLAEALGASVSWEAVTNTASLNLEGSEVKVTIGSKNASINGAAATLDVPAEVTGGRTFIPLRFVSEALGAQVDYDSETKTVSVLLVDTRDWKEFKDADGSKIQYPADWTVKGNSAMGINISSPSGSNCLLKYVQNDPTQVLEEKKTEYTGKGFEVLEEGPADPNDPSQGLFVSLVKENEADQNNSDIVVILASEIDNKTLVVTINTSAANGTVDLALINKIID